MGDKGLVAAPEAFNEDMLGRERVGEQREERRDERGETEGLLVSLFLFISSRGAGADFAYPVQRNYGISVDEWSDQPLVPVRFDLETLHWSLL